MKLKLQIITFLGTLFFVGVVSATGQTMQTESGPPMPPQRSRGGDPIRQLNLSPEQREQIRLLREASREERAAVNQRVHDTNRALEEILDSDSPDELVVEQRVREAAAAQAAAMRMRIINEVKIRRVLTPEQRVMLRDMRKHAQEARGERRLENLEQRQKHAEERALRLREQRKMTGPLFRRPAPPRRPTP